MLKDKRSRMSLLIPPVVQALIFGYAATYDLNHVTYAVLDQDHSAASRELLAGLDGSGVFERVADLQRAGDVKSLIDARRALLVVQIDQDFERHLLSGQSADVQVIADGRNSNTAGTAHGLRHQHRRAVQRELGPRPRRRTAAGADRRAAPGTTRISRRAGS